MHRRRFFTLLGATVASGPARAQQTRRKLVGFLGSETPVQWADRLRAFRAGLADAGYFEGQNLSIEYRWAEGRNDQLPTLANELVRLEVDVLVVLGNTASALVAKASTSTIPIVFRIAGNPVEVGLVGSLSRPGGNVTGVTTLGAELAPKQLELLHELVPSASSFALLVNPTNPALASIQSKDIPAAAQARGLRMRIVNASASSDFQALFSSLKEPRVDGLLIGADTFFNARSAELAALALKFEIPAISPYRQFALAGGVMSYGGDLAAASRQAGAYAGKILKGEKPADLPIEQSSRFEFVINLKSTKALGLPVPPSLLTRADEVIE
jgi:putative ABC transport system substrate-binding protein